MKRKLLLAAVSLLCSVGTWADNTSLLTDNGWNLVSSIADVADNYYVFVDAGNLNNAMARTSNGRPVYTTLADPVSNPGFVWVLDGSESYTLQSLSDEYFFYAGANGWNNSMSLTQSSAFHCTYADGTFKLETTASISYNADTEGKYVGAWDGPSYTFNSDNNTAHLIVTNKSAANAGGFKVYSISRLDYAKKYLAGATSESSKDASMFIVNPSFETGNTTGWTHGSSSDTGAKNYELNPGKDGTYVFNSWWTGVPLTQTIANLPNGTYTLSAYIGSSDDNNDGKVFLTANGDHSTVFTFTKKNANVGVLCSYEFYVTNHSATIGIVGGAADGSYVEGGYWWYKVDNFQLSYKGENLSDYASLLSDAVTKAQALVDGNTIPHAAETALQAIINNNDNDDNAFTTGDEYIDAIDAINTAYDTYEVLESPYATFNALKNDANAIADVEYTDITEGSHSTFSTAITNLTSTVEEATIASTIEAATTELKADIKTYIAGARPSSETDYFDITCLIENPNFDNNTTDGWTYTKSGGTNAANYTCNEFFNNTFDFYQNLSGLPSGSYQLSVQAFSRPGDNGNTTAGAYYDYYNNTNNVTAELYLTSGETTQASKVGNIYAYKESTSAKAGNNFNCTGLGDDNYYVPNDMQSASAYFAAGAYTTEVATRVTDGSLRLGFRDQVLTTNQWTIFDNFKLYYYGPSLARYYQQYLPQLETEIAADYLGNATYDVLKTGQTERTTLITANSADANKLSSELEFDEAIAAITMARDNFVAAKEAYEALNAAATSYTYNEGEGVFQMSSAQVTTFNSYVTTGSTMYTEGTASKADVITATNNIINAYVLNAPDTEKRYTLTIVEDGKTWNGNAVTFVANARKDMGLYGIKYLTPANANMNQALKFTAVDGETNTYKVSAINVETGNEQYITTGTTYSGNDDQIRTTDDAAKASWIKIRATNTANQFQLLNVSSGNKVIANNANNDMYTANSANFTIAEATQASVTVKVASGNFATAIFPVAPGTIDGIKFYSCNEVSGDYVQMEEVTEPVANTPYILQASKDVNTTVSGWGRGKAIAETAGYLTGVYTAATIAASVDATAEADGAYRYVLQTQGGTQAFYKVNADFTATANKAYLTVPVAKTAGAKAFYFNFDEATAIETISALTSDNIEGIYTVGGAKLQSLQKGLNIVKMLNGETKKVIVK